MTHTLHESEHAAILEPAAAAGAAVIWLHGLGADGYDFVPIVEQLQLPQTLAVRFIFPHAQPRPVTINNGYVMRAWYDITSLGGSGSEDATGIRGSEQVVRDLIGTQIASGISAARIAIAGFSQGGAIALHSALRYDGALAGVVALSTYLPLRGSLAAEASAANRGIPILMCHGLHDGVVPPQLGELSRKHLVDLGYTIDWRTYRMEHSVCPEEVRDISRWLHSALTRNL